jgi:hypothetical protein
MMRFLCCLLVLALAIVPAAGCGGSGGGGGGPIGFGGIGVAFLHAAIGTGSCRAHSTATFPDGSCVVVGQYSGMASFGLGDPNFTTLAGLGLRGIFVARYNADGTIEWAKSAGGALVDNATGVATFADGSCVVTGSFEGLATFGLGEANVTNLNDGDTMGDVFVARFNADGTLAWAKRAGGTGSEYGTNIATLSDGSSYVTGKIESSAVFGPGEGNATTLVSAGSDDIFVARYNANGTLSWAKRAGGASQDLAGGIDTLSDGSCLLASFFESATTIYGPGELGQTTLTSAGIFDVCLARYNANGTLAWAKHVVAGPSFDEAADLAAFSDGSCVIGGFFRDTAVFGPGDPNQTMLTSITSTNDAFVARFAADGSLQWARQSGGSAHGDIVRAISALPDGSCAAGGSFSGLALFNVGRPDQLPAIAEGAIDTFVARYGATGSLIWLRTGGGTTDDRGHGVAAHADGSIAACGVFENSAVFNPGLLDETSLFGISLTSAYIVRYDFDGGL